MNVYFTLVTGMQVWQHLATPSYCNVLGGSIHDGTLLHSKSQYTTVKHSKQLFSNSNTRTRPTRTVSEHSLL
jgi:hypothetical protein